MPGITGTERQDAVDMLIRVFLPCIFRSPNPLSEQPAKESRPPDKMPANLQSASLSI